MRFASLAIVALSAFSSVSAWVPAPQPGGTVAKRHPLKQVSREELVARAKYPEHFLKRDNTPSGTPDPCGFSSNSPTRRDLVVDQVLQPREAIAFLKGRGQFTSDNGTAYIDEDYVELLQKGAERAAKWSFASRTYRKVFNTFGTALAAISVPHYKHWKDTLMAGDVLWLSKKTYIRHEDVDELERLLLEDKDWTELEVHGLHLPRSFFEAVTSY
ncbi:hypothetical protein D9611_012472 [Ephemerocybe angulata]|uniref:Uncharacterized protein n=1 Tax=Ephemerocybe angulata TaxID=980116 RepID=A0A8H5CAU4_9AGAR|nr:hypothetical protein D9611_012472 [Tulosesus angulatus]